ncbi:MAG: amidohydrolase [Gammaproteobacteria bacterium]|nr:amidohydrolase [Gammaproteobacteria bacterium]
MGNRRLWQYWLKILGLFLTATYVGRICALIFRTLAYFFNQTLIGRTLVFGSLPLLLLGFVLWPEDYSPPIFDMQVHYNEESWRLVSTNAILNTSDEINVPWMLVGSVPNEGTLKLYQANPNKIIPMLVPQFSREDRDTWFNNPDIQRYMEKELSRGFYRGVGEFFLFDGQTDTPVVRRMVQLAAQHKLVLHARSDPYVIHRLFEMDSSLKILWAHAGMFTPPETVSQLLDRYPRLWVEISHRGDIAPGGKLDKKWRKVLLRHSDRFMLGSGTYSFKYWYQFRNYMRRYRSWLQELPQQVAKRIAYRNGLVLFNLKEHTSAQIISNNKPIQIEPELKFGWFHP